VLRGHLNGNVQAVRYEGKLSVLPAGELPHNPTEVLGSRRMAAVLAQVSDRADFVLIDSPPVLPVADAAVLGRQVDGVLLVIEAGRTRREAAQRAIDSLNKVGANVIGVVLNAVPTARGPGRYYYYSYYGDQSKRRRRRPRGHETPHGTTVIVRPPSPEEIDAAQIESGPQVQRMARRAAAERRGAQAGRRNDG
jgi:Mrp family chromosome partitioning ATPase